MHFKFPVYQLRDSFYYGLLFICLVLGVICCSSSPGKKTSKTDAESARKKDSITEVKLLFAGDIMMHLPEIEAAKTDSGHGFNFTPFFENIAPIVKNADISVANLETTFGGKPYTGYPQFSAPDTLAWFIKKAGFNLIMDANNHSADRSTKGILGTINGLNKAGIAHTGTFTDSLERAKKYPFILEKKGIKFAFLNYTYGTNGLVVHPPVIVNYIDTAQIKKDIETARKHKPDAIIVVFHWGIEYQRLPNEDQKRIARFCLANGIDVIIGMHPHVVQPAYWETYRKPGDTVDRKGLVVYSLGNFVSAQRQPNTDGGIMFSFKIRKNKLTHKISVTDPEFVPTWVYISSNPRSYTILPANARQADSLLVNNQADFQKMNASFQSNSQHMLKGNENWLNEMKK